MGTDFSRRSFLKGAAFAAAGVAGAGALTACSGGNSASSGVLTYDKTIEWNGSYDVVVVGFGAAGSFASISAADEGAQVLLLDKAPLGNEGGNTRYCGQCFVNGRGDVEATRFYYDNLIGEMKVPEDVISTYVEGIAHIEDNYAKTLELNKADFVHATPDSTAMSTMWLKAFSPEYPEFVKNDKLCVSLLHDGGSDGYLWRSARKAVTKRKNKIDVWFESPATRLIQDPQTKTIVGVEVNRKGETLNIRAKNGVVLTCGGFENNPQMIKDYLGRENIVPLGTLYNTGDGIAMAEAAGASFWHMHAFESAMMFGAVSFKRKPGEQGASFYIIELQKGPSIMVGTDGYRYLREDEATRHGHIYANGTWENVKHPTRSFIVYDASKVAEVENSPMKGTEVIEAISAPTIAELAEKIGAKPDVLAKTIEDFNTAATTGNDPAFHRSPESMAPFGQGPYYAIEVMPDILNTQGGPRRNGKAEILDPSGNPIPNLYSAGEFGGLCSNMYNGGGNMAECLIFGQIAGKNAAAAKPDLGEFTMKAVDSKPKYTLGVETDISDDPKSSYTAGANEYLGAGVGIGGDIVVKVTLDGKKISKVTVLEQSETPDRGGVALKKLPQEVLDKQSAEIDAITGATVTSQGFMDAVKDALSQAK